MRHVGLLVGGFALAGLLFFMVVPGIVNSLDPDGHQDTCYSICATSGNVLGRVGIALPILTLATAGVVVGMVFHRRRTNGESFQQEAVAKKCQYCGKELESEWLMCPFCGQSTAG